MDSSLDRAGARLINQLDGKFHQSLPRALDKIRKPEQRKVSSHKPVEKIYGFHQAIAQTHMDLDNNPSKFGKFAAYYHNKHLIKVDDIPDSYFKMQKRLARERGHGNIEINDEMKEKYCALLVTDQKASFNTWFKYLSSSQTKHYPIWAKHWAFNGLLKLGKLDKDTYKFAKRRKDTVGPFADLNHEALAKVMDLIVKKTRVDAEDIKDKKQKVDRLKELIPELEDDSELKLMLEQANFGKLYARELQNCGAHKKENLEKSEGKWVTFPQGSDHMKLVEAIQGQGTGWCTAAEETAKMQLKAGDFHVFFTKDEEGNETVPRLGIRMEGDKIAEARGIGKDQAVEVLMQDEMETELHKYKGADEFLKKSADMKLLTEIEKKTLAGDELDPDELRFLYEIDAYIDSFAQGKDPRVDEIRDSRNSRKDIERIYEGKHVALSLEEIREDTEAAYLKFDDYSENCTPRKYKAEMILANAFNRIEEKMARGEDITVIEARQLYGVDTFKMKDLNCNFRVSLYDRAKQLMEQRNPLADLALINSVQEDDGQGSFKPLSRDRLRLIEKALVNFSHQHLEMVDRLLTNFRLAADGSYEFIGDLNLETNSEKDLVQSLLSLDKLRVTGDISFEVVPNKLPREIEANSLYNNSGGDIFRKSMPESIILEELFESESVSGLKRLPRKMIVDRMEIYGCGELEILPQEGRIRNICIDDTAISSLPEDLDIEDIVLNQEEFKRIVDGSGNGMERLKRLSSISFGSDLVFEEIDSDELPDNIHIITEGDMDLSDSKIKRFPRGVDLFEGSVFLSGVRAEDTVLPPVSFTGDLMMDGSNFTELPDNLHVPGDLVLENSQISKWPKGLKVDGDIYINGTKLGAPPVDAIIGGKVHR